ncbi:MAG: hypothetical protein JJ896_03095 [Rhodothermales bacterium]|nr:hypothetical protein [Rhodothermales bacterium]MBO6778619.1 hypothetical protein [Rhodothermales bacterium]
MPPYQIASPGFDDDAFSALSDLQERPVIEQYQEDRERIQRAVVAPFKLYRDDLVLNWVLPAQWPLETERNVFSRIPKNDFGKGGANHHYWLSFYRPSRSRLKDIQLAHSLFPDRFVLGLYAFKGMGAAWTEARPAIENGLNIPAGFSVQQDRNSIWIRRSIPREEVRTMGSQLVAWALEGIERLEPIYGALTGLRPAVSRP